MDKYTFLSRHGAGSYAVVWKARRKSDGKLVAIKQLKDTVTSWEAVKALAEVQYLGKLRNHPNVIRLEEVVKMHSQAFLVFNYCDGNMYQTMQSMLREGQSFREQEVRWLVKEVLQGLAYAHSKGYMHRDVKPENILLSAAERRAKLCDFGQAKAVEFGGDFTPYVSTRWYRAPELLLKARRYTPAVDMWALGALMAELYSLRPLFSGSSEADMLFKIGSTLGTPTGWAEGQALAQKAGYHFPRVEALGLASLIPAASPDALAFMRALLQFNPANRPTAEAALRLPFMQGPTEYVAPIVGTPRPSDEAAAKAEAAKFMRSMSQRKVSHGAPRGSGSGGGGGKRSEGKDGSGHSSEDEAFSGKSDESGGGSPTHRRAISQFADTEQGRAAAANHAAYLAARSSLQRNDTSKTSYSDGASGAGSGVGAGAGGGRGDRRGGRRGSGGMGRKTQSFQQQPRRTPTSGRGRGDDVGEDYSATVLHGPAVGSLGLRGKTSSNHSNGSGSGRARASPGASSASTTPAGLRVRGELSGSLGSSAESPLSSVAGSPRTDAMDVSTPMTNLFGRHGAASGRTNGAGAGAGGGASSSLATPGAVAVAPSAKFGRHRTNSERRPVAGRRATTGGGRPAGHAPSLSQGGTVGRRRRTDAGTASPHSKFPSASGQRGANKMGSTAGSSGSGAGILSRIKALGNSFEDVSYDFDDATLGSGLR